MRRDVFFRRAVFLALGLPACGGALETKTPAEDAGSTGAGVDAALPLPPLPKTNGACGWSVAQVSTCEWTYSFQGDPNACASGVIGVTGGEPCANLCGSSASGVVADSCVVIPAEDGGTNTLQCYATQGSCNAYPPVGNGGRRTAYFAALGFGPPPAGRELGVHFARVACMEAGSIEAFRALRDELLQHRAPRRLVRAAERAIRDEERHLRQTSALARRYGEKPVSPLPVPPRAARTLEAMALENAVEGCVRETYSALECVWQAEAAADPVVRAVMKQIARDEMRHLSLSWEVHAWATSRLGQDARRRIADAQEEEIAVMLEELAVDPHDALVRTGGLPRSAASRALIDSIRVQVAA